MSRTPALPPKRRGPNGERLCRMCGKPVPPGRLEWCGQECVDLRASQHQAGARRLLKVRDGGVCALCGLDCSKLRRVFRAVRHRCDRLFGWQRGAEVARAWLARRVGRAVRVAELERRSWWDADHVVPLVEGGPHGMANLRTLCVWCHRAETAKLAARRAERQRAPRSGSDG